MKSIIRVTLAAGIFAAPGESRNLARVRLHQQCIAAFIANAVNIDDALKKPLGLTKKEQKDLVAFLKTLTDKVYQKK